MTSAFHVEATTIAVALTELQLLPTKQLIYQVLYDAPANSEDLKPFSDKDLAVIYEQSFDFDGNLLCLALESGSERNKITEALTLLFMVQDLQL